LLIVLSTGQQNLFSEEGTPWEEDDRRDRLIARVVFPEGPPEPYDYEVPEPLRPAIQAGQRVLAPLGRGDRPLVGYCVELTSKPELQRKLKCLSQIIDTTPLLTPAMLRLTRWMSDYYICPWGDTLQTVLPAAVRSKQALRELTLIALSPHVARIMAAAKPPKITAKQQAVLDHLRRANGEISLANLSQQCDCSPAPIHSLREKKLVIFTKRYVGEGVGQLHTGERDQPWQLNVDQQRALDVIHRAQQAGEHTTVVLHGVTGSGKTEVYMQAIAETLRFKRQAIILVPEISLTPQTRERFLARFEHVAVLHSQLRDAERLWHWERIARGEVSVIVGARSAIFAPCPQLGLVILDEEHEGSFKQDKAPRYHARDVALFRTRAELIPLVLGSATPSLETWQRAISGEAVLCDLPTRVSDRPLPLVKTIDLRIEAQNKMNSGAITRTLHIAMKETLDNRGQVILLLNRRGYSTHIQCPQCGEAARCPHCDLALTHHRHSDLAICHYCDYQTKTPSRCGKCQFQGLKFAGVGTQKLEAEVRARFREARVLRMDTDTMKAPGSYAAAFDSFRKHEIDILLGTQMIAKGLDFPNVTLVGVINADTALHLPDYRAAERTFQLVTQVAGRTGRGERGGRVLVQTFNPDHPAIVAATKHDYAAFANVELPVRQLFHYPPYWPLARMIVRGPSEPVALAVAQHLAAEIGTRINTACPESRILGPAAAPIAKIRDLYRFHFQIQCPDQEVLRAALRSALSQQKIPEGVQCLVDIDPQDML
jgi:primosomal protein N' (replication factor Y) (superfamily II helicase)